MMRKFSEPVALTPAKAFTPTKRPTITLSTRLYTCWNRFPSSNGNQKPNISLMGEPWVISRTMQEPPGITGFAGFHLAWLFILSICVLDKSAFGLKEIDMMNRKCTGAVSK